MSAETFERFFDDAAIFPPGLAPLDQAVVGHLSRRGTGAERFVGPLILPVDRIDEAGVLAGGQGINISAIASVDTLDQLSGYLGDHSTAPQMRIVSVEAKCSPHDDVDAWLPALTRLRAEYPQLRVFMELPYAAITADLAERMREAGIGLKFRTGGVTADLFPTTGQLIDVLAIAVGAALPFKLTAGLHRAVRYRDPVTTAQHFGFLNIAAGVVALLDGADRRTAIAEIDSEDGAALGRTVCANTRWRKCFTSFGTCSVAEPLETLFDIGLASTSDLDGA